MKISIPAIVACNVLLNVLIPVSARAAAPLVAPATPPQAMMASHRAVYSVSLTATRPGGDFVDVSGKMSLEFVDKCDVWKTTQQSLLHTITGEGGEESSRSDFTAWESKAGDLYTFSIKQTQNGDVSEFSGSASRAGKDGSGTAEYSKPQHKNYTLPPHFNFPTAQQIEIIEIARKGIRFFGGEMFDGSEGGGASRFNAVILKPASVAVLDPSRKNSYISNTLLDGPAYRVRIAFYPPAGASSGEDDENASDSASQPEYEVTMTLHDNGIISDYDYDYQDFSVHGKLEAIKALPRPHC